MSGDTQLAVATAAPPVRRKSGRVRIDRWAEVLRVVEPSGKSILVPVSEDSNKRLSQVQAARLREKINDYMEVNGSMVDWTPRMVKDLADAIEKTEKIAGAAHEEKLTAREEKNAEKRNLVKDAAEAALMLAERMKRMRERDSAIDAEVVDA